MLSIVVAVAALAHALLGAVFCDQSFEAGGGVLATLVGMHDESSRWPAQGLADQVFGHRVTHVLTHELARTAVELHG